MRQRRLFHTNSFLLKNNPLIRRSFCVHDFIATCSLNIRILKKVGAKNFPTFEGGKRTLNQPDNDLVVRPDSVIVDIPYRLVFYVFAFEGCFHNFTLPVCVQFYSRASPRRIFLSFSAFDIQKPNVTKFTLVENFFYGT